MCSRGVWQLKQLTLQYCPHGGSSAGMREFIKNELSEFQSSSSLIKYEPSVYSNRHPLLIAHYKNGTTTEISCRKNNIKQIRANVQKLRDRTGRMIPWKWGLTKTSTHSVQGYWDPSFNYVPVQEQIKSKVVIKDKLLGWSDPIHSSSTISTTTSTSPTSSSSTSKPSNSLHKSSSQTSQSLSSSQHSKPRQASS